VRKQTTFARVRVRGDPKLTDASNFAPRAIFRIMKG
jgi:hypothetical protein